ncbi:MAG: BatD family protein [Thermodesulfobacteriota bacterium]|nr:BatD family protein [Thermodesulfobacteriota bacterium]
MSDIKRKQHQCFIAGWITDSRLIWILVVLLWAMPAAMPGFGETLSVKAEVDRTTMSSGETLTLTVKIKGADGQINTSGIRDFEVLSTNASQNYSIINGKTSREVRYRYTLVPEKQGRLLIPPLPVTIGQKTLYTELIAVQVRKAGDEATIDAQRDVFARVDVSDTSPYVGQQIVLRLALYNAVRIGNAELRKGPVFEGVDARKLDKSRSYAKIINDRRYDVTELVYILTPEQAGTYQVGQSRIMCEVITQVSGRSRFPFNSFFNDSRMVPSMVDAPPVEITVRPLPTNSGSKDYSGLVGAFDISASVDPTTLAQGDSCNLSIMIQGRGNIQDAAMPDLRLPDTFKVYKDAPVEDIDVTEQGVAGSKQFAAALVALTPGTYTIGPFSLTYFDTDQERYITETTRMFTIAVNENPGATQLDVYEGKRRPAETGVQKKTVDFTGKDIFSIEPDMDALKNHRAIAPVVFVLMLLAPYLLLAILIVFFSRRRITTTPARMMARQARTELKSAGNDRVNLADHLYRALIYAIFAKAGKQGASLTHKEVAAMLAQAGCKPDFIETVGEVLDRVESARFGGVTMDDRAAADLLAAATRIVRRLIA